MNSTMLIPKCSSTIVLRPILALDSQSSTVEYDALTTNSTWAYVCESKDYKRKLGNDDMNKPTSIPSSFTRLLRSSTRLASLSFRLPPTRTSLTELVPSEDSMYSGYL